MWLKCVEANWIKQIRVALNKVLIKQKATVKQFFIFKKTWVVYTIFSLLTSHIS